VLYGSRVLCLLFSGHNMKALINKSSRKLVALVESTEGYDLDLYDVIDAPPGDPQDVRWDGVQFVPRPPSPVEQIDAALGASQWVTLRSATPEQVDAWLNSNVTSVASARQVLRFLVLAVKRLSNDPRTGL
jgi:hypothetical protein